MKNLTLILMLCLMSIGATAKQYITDQYGNQWEVTERKDADYYDRQNLQQLQLQNELNRQREYYRQRQQQYQQPQNNGIHVIEDTTTGGYYQRRKAQRANQRTIMGN